MPSTNQIRAQSENAYGQWCEQWRKQAKEHSIFKMKNLIDFANVGIGKACLLIANGYSTEKNFEIIAANHTRVDTFVCDKGMGHLIDRGISPTYVMVCDANVDYEKYCEKWKDKVSETILFVNVCGNPKWATQAKWKDVYFFANEDILGSEKEFMKLSGCPNKIPAATNVSNAMAVMMTQSDNTGRRNFFGYDKYLLIGFDYSWSREGNYYAFDQDGDGKAKYMKHHHLMNIVGGDCYTSNNLLFSAQWLQKYINTFRLPIFQCTTDSILNIGAPRELEKEMQYSFKPYHRDIVTKCLKQRTELVKSLNEIDLKLAKISQEHSFSIL